MNCSPCKDGSHNERGQILWIFAVVLPILILFVGLAIDVGFAWVTKSLLSSAVDAAALAGMRNVNLGQTQAKAIAQSAFNVNYGAALNRDATAPVVTVVFSTDSNSNTVVNVGATATLNTFLSNCYLAITSGMSLRALRPLAPSSSCRWCWTNRVQ